MFKPIYEAIQAHDCIILHRHANPDGDALGSQIGLKHILLENFPEKKIYMVGDAAKRYSFMADSVMDDVADDMYRDALAIILDTSAESLISDSRYALAKTTARIDHHLFAGPIAAIEAVDPSYESCCGMIAEFARSQGLRVPPLAAQSLFTGMVTDSGRFRYDSTSARSFRLAAFLMEQPFDVNEIYRNLYAGDFDQLRLRAEFTLKIQMTEKNVAYIYTSLAEMAALSADSFAISRGMVGVMADIKGVDIWANFTETAQGVLCELRSSRYNINPIAVRYGGGGHAKASGATLQSREEALRMLQELDALAGTAP